MNKQDVSVLIIALLISTSGIVVNLLKKGGNTKVKIIKDGTTLLWFRILVPFALLLSLVVYFLKISQLELSKFSIYPGIVLVAFGLVIRWIAIISLGNAFTVKVSILKNHLLKTDGVYKNIRHPSYTGLLIYYFGLGLVMQNWGSIFILLVLPIFAVLNRIQVEEKVLTENFKTDYINYKKRSWRLFPFIY